MKRTELKRGTKTLRRSSFKRKSKPKEQIEQEKEDKEAMWQMFLEIWNERPHYCEETGIQIYGEPLTTMFHHVLEKEENKYPQFKLCKWNIMILLPEIHDQAHKNIDKTPKVKFKREYLLDKYVNNQ